MQIANNTWTQVGGNAPAKLVLQNRGSSNLAYVFSATQPEDDDIDMVSGDFFVLKPDYLPVTVTGLDAENRNMYVRSIGAGFGRLTIDTV